MSDIELKVILNLTQHIASPEQIAAGVKELAPADSTTVKRLLTFDTLEDAQDASRVLERAMQIAAIAAAYKPNAAMVGCAPYFIRVLCDALRTKGITPLFAFTQRVSVEKDGIKTSVFRHEGFVEEF
jgi:hypothetical protein